MTKNQVSANALTLVDGMIERLSSHGRGSGRKILRAHHSGDEWLQHNAESLLFLGARKKNASWELPGERPEDYLYFARALYEVLLDSLPKLLQFPVTEMLEPVKVMSTWPPDKFISRAKFVCVWPFAKYAKQVLPSVPEGFEGSPLLFKGRISRILKNRLVSITTKNTRLWFGILQGVKRGASPISQQYIRQSMLDHRNALSQSPEMTQGEQDKFVQYLDAIFAGLDAEPKMFDASSSAALGVTRSSGGGHEKIFSQFKRNFYDYQVEPRLRQVGRPHEAEGGLVVDVPGLLFGPDLYYAILMAESEQQMVEVHAIMEPLKCRLITKGPPHRMWVARFFQKAMWHHLFKMEQFRLIGEPLNASHLYGVIDRERKAGIDFGPRPLWVSGDFRGATDSVKLDATKLAFEAALYEGGYSWLNDPDPSDWGRRIAEILRSVIYEQEIHYPPKMKIDPLKQVTGQLMGSVLSFPLLCAINLACYWQALEDYYSDLTGNAVSFELVELPVLVNGDDILFRCDATFYEYWLKSIDRVGFKLSLGKNYVHPTLLMINSELWSYDPHKNVFRTFTYLNTGHLIGQSKVTGRKAVKDLPIWDLYNHTVFDAVDSERAHRRFMHYHADSIKRYTLGGRLSLTVHPLLGGFGFRPLKGSGSYVSKEQIALARFLWKRYLSTVEQGIVPSPLVALVSKVPVQGALVPTNPRRILQVRGLFEPLHENDQRVATKVISNGLLTTSKWSEDPERAAIYVNQHVLKQFSRSNKDYRSELPVWWAQGAEGPRLPFELVERLGKQFVFPRHLSSDASQH